MKHFKITTIALLLMSSTLGYAQEIVIELHGVNKQQQHNILSTLSLHKVKKEDEITSGHLTQLHEKAQEEIQLALQPFGYYHVQVQSNLEQQENKVKAIYHIQLGLPTRVGILTFEVDGPGKHHPQLQHLGKDFPLHPNDIFLHEVYEDGKSQAQQRAYQEGYIKAYFTKREVVVDLSQYEADIHLVLETGNQYTLGPVTFENTYYKTKFLNRFAQFESYEPYRAETLVTLESRLLQSGLFKKALIQPDIQDDSTVVPLQVDLEDAPANRYLLGLGYDTNTRARFRVGWDRKKINTKGHQLKSQFKISEKDTLFDAVYHIPGQKPWVDNYQIAFNYADDEYKDRPSELYTFALSETRQLRYLNRTISIRYLNETFTDSDGVKEHSTFLLPSVSLSKSHYDSLIDPKNGYKAELIVRGGVDALFSDADFFQIYGQYKWLRGLSSESTFISRFELGATFPNDIERLPLSIRYYAGGIDSLRGFRYRSIPFEVNDQGELEPVGGAYLAIASLEIDRTLWGPLKGAIFADGGGAFRKFSDDWQLGVGFGLRWQTPVGPIKLDIAKPLSSAAEVWRLHFSFGPQI